MGKLKYKRVEYKMEFKELEFEELKENYSIIDLLKVKTKL